MYALIEICHFDTTEDSVLLVDTFCTLEDAMERAEALVCEVCGLIDEFMPEDAIGRNEVRRTDDRIDVWNELNTSYYARLAALKPGEYTEW
jgi:hypothetical protein